VLVMLSELANAAEPRIRLIETFSTNQVVIHYDPEPSSKTSMYVLQASTNLSSTNWSNIQTGYNFPFPFPYHVYDSRTNTARFYRLRVTTP